MSLCALQTRADVLVETLSGEEICAQVYPTSFHGNGIVPKSVRIEKTGAPTAENPNCTGPVKTHVASALPSSATKPPSAPQASNSEKSSIKSKPLPGIIQQWLSNNSAGCLDPQTQVSTPQGPVRLEKLSVGDTVFAVDPATYQLVPTMITAKVQYEVDLIATVNVTGADGNISQLKGTMNHPIMTPTSERIANPYHLIYDWIRQQSPAGLPAVIANPGQGVIAASVSNVKLSMLKEKMIVMDISVESPFHNFIGNGLVIHNALMK